MFCQQLSMPRDQAGIPSCRASFRLLGQTTSSSFSMQEVRRRGTRVANNLGANQGPRQLQSSLCNATAPDKRFNRRSSVDPSVFIPFDEMW